MGLMDKVKAQATQLAQKTQESAQAGMAKFDSAQLARRSDPLLKSLGLAVLAERTGRGAPDNQAQIDQLITALTQHEAQNNVDLVAQAAQAQAQQAQMQMGGGQFLGSAPPVDPNVPGAPAGFPGYAPASFPDAAPAAGFPGAAPATGFPGAAPATGFPEAAPAASVPAGPPSTGFPEATAFPSAAPTAFPEPSPAPAAAAFPPSAQPEDEGQPGGQTGFPPAAEGA